MSNGEVSFSTRIFPSLCLFLVSSSSFSHRHPCRRRERRRSCRFLGLVFSLKLRINLANTRALDVITLDLLLFNVFPLIILRQQLEKYN